MGILNFFKKKAQASQPPENNQPPPQPLSPTPKSNSTPASAQPPKTSPSAAITSPISKPDNFQPHPSATAKPHTDLSPSQPLPPKPSSIVSPQASPLPPFPVSKSTSTIGPSGRPPLSASQMIRPAGIKIPSKYIPPSGFRPPPPPPTPPPSFATASSSTSNYNSTSAPPSESAAHPPKPKQILSSSVGITSEPLPPPHPPHASSIAHSTTKNETITPDSSAKRSEPSSPHPISPASSYAQEIPKPASESSSLDLNSCTIADLLRIPSLPKRLAESIVQYRETHGHFSALEDLLKVPEMTPITYTLLTGQEAPQNYKPTKSIREHLSIPNGQEITSKTIVERISSWPDLTGCILSDHQNQVIAANLIGAISPEKLATAAKHFTSLTHEQLSPLHQSQATEIIIPGPAVTFYFIASPKVIFTLIYSISTPPPRHMEILREIIAQIEIQ